MRPTRRQIIFNWLMDAPLFETKIDGYWGDSDDVAHIDALLAALDAAKEEGETHGG